MSWTVKCFYVAPDTDARAAVSDVTVTYEPHSGAMQVAFEVQAGTLEEAAVSGLSTAAKITGLRPARLCVQRTADFVADHDHPAPLDLDLIGITQIAGELGVSRQRAGKLADDPDFPAPVLRTAAGRLYTRESVKAFQQRWIATRNPRGGRRRRSAQQLAS